MESDLTKNESISKGNSEDSLLVIYILDILKKYSSPKKPLSSQDVMEYLKTDYSIGYNDKAKAEAQKKKVRRHLDTLYESYPSGCIKKEEGKTIRGHKWYYDSSRDKFADKNIVIPETLTETEVDVLVDLISATKILNSEGTIGMIDKLLKKTSISDEDRARRLKAIQGENWLKTPNDDLFEKKALIEDYFYDSYITFDYGGEESITAIPCGWSYDDGICFLDAKVGDESLKFSLDKIRICGFDEDACEDSENFSCYNEETDSNKTALDSLFVNMPTIKSAIADKKCIKFFYRSYAVSNGKVVPKDEEKSVLPHRLVFNDGKYYLIGIDEDVTALNKIAYFRVDLMFEVYCVESKFKLSDWDKHIFETIERARVVEKHPLMLAGTETEVTFKVVESALDRVVDAFATKPDKFDVTNETRAVKNSSDEGFHEERVVKFQVITSVEEAYRWALSNAEAVEIVTQDIRDKIARIADPVYQLYTQTLPDKVRENIDYVLKEKTFKITYLVDEKTAYATYKELAKTGKLDVVDNMGIAGDEEFDNLDYFGAFVNTERLILSASKIKNLTWASKLINVKTLKMTSSQAEDATWMKDMKKLIWVYLTDSCFSDLSVLSEHREIADLDISGTKVRDISFIENFEKLTHLHIAVCPIKDYSPLLTTKSNLQYLEIDKKALEKIGEQNIRNRHIGISIKVTNNSPFWFL